MYKKILVEDLIKEGKLLVEALERIRFPITAAVWYDFPETQWMLVIVSPVVDRIGPMAAYGRIQRALQTVQPSRLVLSDISLMSPLGQEFQNLRSLVSAPARFGHSAATGRTRNLVFEMPTFIRCRRNPPKFQTPRGSNRSNVESIPIWSTSCAAMAIPRIDIVRALVLQLCGDDREHSYGEMESSILNRLGLSADDLAEKLSNGRTKSPPESRLLELS
jgi:hypothetical protein